jgi:muramoyltetrapeptide carboxypeptidase
VPSSREFKQRYLSPGGRIELVAPAGPFDLDEFARGVARLRRHYDVHHTPGILERQGYLAGDDARRSAELHAALARPNVDAIMAARGGYGSTRILAQFSVSDVQRHAPLLVGFSDLSALHALWARAEVGSLHGNMVAGLGRCDEPLFARFCAALEGRFSERIGLLETLVPGVAEGVLLGGNLAVLSALLGTPYFPPLDDAVLFLEDIGERPYRVDRMLTSWRDAGAFRAVRAVVLGNFAQADAGPDGVTLAHVLSERLSDLGIPVAAGLRAGHVDDNLELPFGRRVTLDATAGCLHVHPQTQRAA